jgi:hypothetical protein
MSRTVLVLFLAIPTFLAACDYPFSGPFSGYAGTSEVTVRDRDGGGDY